MAVMTQLRTYTANLIDFDALSRTAFSIDGWSGFSGKDISDKRDYYYEQIEIETQAMERRRQVGCRFDPSVDSSLSDPELLMR